MNLVRTMVLVMIYLTLTLPFIHAATLSNTFVMGETSGVENVVLPEENITVSVDVTGADDASANLFFENENGEVPFDACVDTATHKSCSLELPFVASGRTEYGYLVSYTGAESAIIGGTFIVDERYPSVSIQQLYQNGKNITVRYAARDTEEFMRYTGDDAQGNPQYSDHTDCGGLQTIELFVDGTPLLSSSYDGKICQDSGLITATVPDSIEDGEKQVMLRVTDAMGYMSNNTRTREFNFSQTAIANPRIVYPGTDQTITHVSEDGTRGIILFETSGDLAQQTTVRLNEESIGTISCSRNTCRSRSIPIRDAGDYVIDVNAINTRGVASTAQVTQTIELDNQPPIVSRFSSSIADGSINFIHDDTNITVDFTETGSGMSKGEVELRIGSLTYTSPSCSDTSCVFSETFTQNTNNYTVKITGKDNSGNEMDLYQTWVLADKTKPRIYNISVGGVEGEWITADSLIEVNFTVDEDSPFEAWVNAERIGGSERKVATCINNTWCTVGFNAGDEYASSYLRINVNDTLGNFDRVNTEGVTVLGDAEDGDYFAHRFSLSPSAIELSAAEFVEQKLYGFIEVVPEESSTVVTNVAFNRCTGLSTQEPENVDPFAALAAGSIDSSSYFTYSDIPQTDSSIAIEFTSRATNYDLPYYLFNCTVLVDGVVNNRAFVSQEVESVLVNISTYNLDAGELGEGYEDKVADAIDNAQNHISSKLEALEELFAFAEMICNLFYIIKGVVSVISTLVYVLDIECDVLKIFPPAAVACEAVPSSICNMNDIAIDTALEGMMLTIQGVCDIITCRTSLLGAIGVPTPGEMLGSAMGGTTSNIGEGQGLNGPEAGEYNYQSGGALSSTKYTNDNLGGAIMNFCIPAIIKNLKKHQEIQCKYALCLAQEVPQQGKNPAVCDAEYEYAECVYMWSAIFGLNPLIALWNYLVNWVKSLIANPLALIGFGWGIICASTCAGDPKTPHTSCRWGKLLMEIGELANLLAAASAQKDSMGDDPGTSYCLQLDEFVAPAEGGDDGG